MIDSKMIEELVGKLDELAKKDTIGDKISKVQEENLPKEALYEMLTKEELIILLEQSAQNIMKDALTIAFLMTKLNTEATILHPMQDEYKEAAAKVMSGRIPEQRLLDKNNLLIKL